MRMSVIIVNWNGKDLLKKCMPSIVTAAKQTKVTYEIIVVDNGSVDSSIQFLKSEFPKVRVIALNENTGFTKASNLGAKNAKGDILVFLNNDIMLEKDSLGHMLRHFKNPKVFGVSPKLIKWDKKTIQAEFIGCSFILGTVVQTQPNMDKVDKNEFKEPRLTFFALGGASAIDRKKFLDLGGFDELYSPFYWEEIDVSYRAYKRGWKCLYEPRAVFYHKHRATLSKAFSSSELQLQEFKTRFIFTWSNFDREILFKHFLFLPLVFLRSAFKSSYRSSRFLDIKAFFLALRHIEEIIDKREKGRRYAKLTDKEVLDLINSNKANELAPISIWKMLGFK